jgi:hypothetical protein
LILLLHCGMHSHASIHCVLSSVPPFCLFHTVCNFFIRVARVFLLWCHSSIPVHHHRHHHPFITIVNITQPSLSPSSPHPTIVIPATTPTTVTHSLARRTTRLQVAKSVVGKRSNRRQARAHKTQSRSEIYEAQVRETEDFDGRCAPSLVLIRRWHRACSGNAPLSLCRTQKVESAQTAQPAVVLPLQAGGQHKLLCPF